VTEAEWLACADPKQMLAFLVSKVSARKLSLFACACSRQVWHLLDERPRKAVEASERYADGLARQPASVADANSAASAAQSTAGIARDAARRANYLAAAAAGRPSVPHDAVQPSGPQDPELARLAGLLREVVGNPFRMVSGEGPWLPVITRLAGELEAGEDCAAALHGTLLTAGHAELAEHFRGPAKHPRGCWALDLLLGRTWRG
jgi:hypothetical protein